MITRRGFLKMLGFAPAAVVAIPSLPSVDPVQEYVRKALPLFDAPEPYRSMLMGQYKGGLTWVDTEGILRGPIPSSEAAHYVLKNG